VLIKTAITVKRRLILRARLEI